MWVQVPLSAPRDSMHSTASDDPVNGKRAVAIRKDEYPKGWRFIMSRVRSNCKWVNTERRDDRSSKIKVSKVEPVGVKQPEIPFEQLNDEQRENWIRYGHI